MVAYREASNHISLIRINTVIRDKQYSILFYLYVLCDKQILDISNLDVTIKQLRDNSLNYSVELKELSSFHSYFSTVLDLVEDEVLKSLIGQIFNSLIHKCSVLELFEAALELLKEQNRNLSFQTTPVEIKKLMKELASVKDGDKIYTHFMEKTIHKINGKAKAMVVTSSRAHAVRYKQILDKLIHEKYNDKISTIVAFSGVVEINEHKYTEENMNGFGIKDAAIRDRFNDDDCKILIVANKFQTGFDQPLLHTMYVDKQLGGVQAIQTLSRLNRRHDDKEDTMIIDFVNEHSDIQKSFQPYYQSTQLKGEVNTQRLYDLKSEIDDYRVFNEAQIELCMQVLLDKNRNPEELSPLFRQIVEDKVEPLEKDIQGKFRKIIDSYTRQYSFLSQLMTFIDPELEKYYLFSKLLYKFLPYTKETLPLDILERINLDKFKIQELESGSIGLEKTDGELKGVGSGGNITSKTEEFNTLKDLLKEINEPYKGFLEENDKLIYSLFIEVVADKEIQEAFNAQNTADVLIELVKSKFETKSFERINEYVSLMSVISENQAFSESFFRKAFEFMIAATKTDRPEYDEEKLKLIIYEKLYEEFSELAGVSYRDLKEVIDWLFLILNETTINSLDGLNKVLKETFNNFYSATNNRDIDLQIYFQTFVSKYEAFLRKIYFMREGKELESEERNTGLVYVVQQFPEIQRLYRNFDPKLSNFGAFYNSFYDWRNTEAHTAPILLEEELVPALHTMTSLYVYAAMINATDLEMSGY